MADELGVDFADVTVIQGDTAATPFGPGTGGSRSAVLCSGAASAASAKVRTRMLDIAAHALEAAPEDLEVAGGAARHADHASEHGMRVHDDDAKGQVDRIGVEAECSLEFLQTIMPADAVIQGNLDPLLLLCDEDVVRRETLKLVRAIPRNRHIFNLGHGIKQQTNPDILTTVIETIRGHDRG